MALKANTKLLRARIDRCVSGRLVGLALVLLALCGLRLGVAATHLMATSPSIGIARFPVDGRSLDELYKVADLALYAAKRQGRKTWRLLSRARTPSERQRSACAGRD